MNMNIIFAGNVKLTWLGSYSCTAVYPTVLCIDLLIGRIATQVLNNKRAQCIFVLGVVAEWSKVLIPVPCPIMVWSTLALGTYQLKFISWVFHAIFSFIHFISLYTLGGLCAFRKKRLPYNMYLFNLWIANHILIKIYCTITWLALRTNNQRWLFCCSQHKYTKQCYEIQCFKFRIYIPGWEQSSVKYARLKIPSPWNMAYYQQYIVTELLIK